jgi:hypothetical protein
MNAPRGYAAIPGLYRVPDLLTEKDFIDYMWNNYQRKVEFTDTENYVNPARALGRSAPIGVPDETDEVVTPKDHVLIKMNEMDWSTPVEDEEKEETKENTPAVPKKPTVVKPSK